MTRSQRYLAGLLVIQVALILLFKSPLSGNTGTSTESHPLLPQMAKLDAERIEFLGKDGKDLNVKRVDGDWSVVEAGNFPADGSKITKLLDELTTAKVRQPVVSSDRYHKTFKVTEDDNEGRVRVFASGADKPAVELILGTSSNYMLNHVRVKGDDRVYEVRGLGSYEMRADADNWINKTLVDVPTEQVVGLSLKNGAGSIEVARKDGQWSLVAPAEMAGQALDQSKVDDLVRVASTLRIQSAAGALDEQGQGLADPATTVTLRVAPPGDAGASGATPQEVVVRLGGHPPDKDTQRYVTRSGLPFAATVWDSSVKSLIEKTAKDLLPSATEAPASS